MIQICATFKWMVGDAWISIQCLPTTKVHFHLTRREKTQCTDLGCAYLLIYHNYRCSGAYYSALYYSRIIYFTLHRWWCCGGVGNTTPVCLTLLIVPVLMLKHLTIVRFSEKLKQKPQGNQYRFPQRGKCERGEGQKFDWGGLIRDFRDIWKLVQIALKCLKG